MDDLVVRVDGGEGGLNDWRGGVVVVLGRGDKWVEGKEWLGVELGLRGIGIGDEGVRGEEVEWGWGEIGYG